jgi:hypothetical protein
MIRTNQLLTIYLLDTKQRLPYSEIREVDFIFDLLSLPQ